MGVKEEAQKFEFIDSKLKGGLDLQTPSVQRGLGAAAGMLFAFDDQIASGLLNHAFVKAASHLLVEPAHDAAQDALGVVIEFMLLGRSASLAFSSV